MEEEQSGEKPKEICEEKCEKCGSFMTLKRSRKGETWYLCSNETCRHRVEVKMPETEDEEA